MPERDRYIPGVPCWVDTSQPDPRPRWLLQRPLRLGVRGRHATEVTVKHSIGRVRDGDVAAVGSIPAGAPPVAMWNTYVAVASADETAARVREAGGTVVMEPFDVMDSGRMAVVASPTARSSGSGRRRHRRGSSTSPAR